MINFPPSIVIALKSICLLRGVFRCLLCAAGSSEDVSADIDGVWIAMSMNTAYTVCGDEQVSRHYSTVTCRHISRSFGCVPVHPPVPPLVEHESSPSLAPITPPPFPSVVPYPTLRSFLRLYLLSCAKSLTFCPDTLLAWPLQLSGPFPSFFISLHSLQRLHTSHV